jgi:glycerol-3-phosphate dehydrogenase (NAD(P)+)
VTTSTVPHEYRGHERFAVLGAGSWGTALAIHLGRIGHDVTLWARDETLVGDMKRARVNVRYLEESPLPDNVKPTADMHAALADSRFVVLAVPSHGLRTVMQQAAALLAPDAVLISTAKGLESGSLARMSQVMAQETGERMPIVVLSGPSFALEVARGLPTAILAASADLDAAAAVQERFRGPAFRLYANDDVTGVEIGGALKNIIAIAAGVVEGLGLGHNALAALITRGLAEMSRLACAAGAKRETLSGLTGLGDLVLTCTGHLSRNRHVGMELAGGRALQDVLGGMKMVAEGVRTTEAALALAARYRVELPIAAQVAELLTGRKDARTALSELMIRPQKAEVG